MDLPPASAHIVKKLPSHIQRYLSSLTPDEALAFAKRDIENASVASDDDPELYGPLFRNISTFKRSYEWMEWMLKVYIYGEGRKPIFHTPHRTGIYSSEGWFLMLMEENRQFVTKDPEKAHLFYLPYSARQLQMELYVPNSHNLKPLAVFLRDYVNMLAAKYPFWNRTHGSDHFLVACHDWGPYILKEHEELQRNTIKALCNADVSEKIFLAGKDVSLPETTIRQPRRPQRNVGGNRASQRPILAFFAGHRHGRVRPTLLKYWSDKDDDMRIYGPLPNRASRVMSYPQHMKSSKYCICPMGFEVNSPRIVEAIYYECVPVIIADNFVPPLSEVLNWDAFSVTVAEKDIPKLKEILLAIPLRKYLIMQTNVKKVQKHFLWNLQPVPYDLFHMILHSIWLSRLNQIQVPQPS
ncbi:putative glycosyltransferase [Sesamum alatum]|uniref:Glycosyltransferase n=1 Tax=Sesamum alatum TaxID=300844 RepID=A0AAE1YQX9_9LAMI|nr:putative glycosyltransferase [Sesamum alatum]